MIICIMTIGTNEKKCFKLFGKNVENVGPVT